MLTETITWQPASPPPNDDRTVLMACGDGVHSGYYLPWPWGWYDTTGTPLQPEDVRSWAEMPKGPTCQ